MLKITDMPKNVEKAIADVIVKKSEWETINKIDQENRRKILQNNIFKDEESGERILNTNDDFMMSESDFEKYCKLAYSENLKSGIDSGGWEFNFFPYEKAVWDAEDKFIDEIAKDISEFTPEKVKITKTDRKYREKFLKITFGENYKV